MPLDDPKLCAELSSTKKSVDSLGKKLDKFHSDLMTHAQHEAELKKAIDGIMQAFPDGVDKHREAHEAMITAAKAQENFWNELKLDLAKKGIWGVFLILIGILVTGISVKMGWAK